MALRNLLAVCLFGLLSISNCESISDTELREKGYRHISKSQIEYSNGDFAVARDFNCDGIIDRIDYYQKIEGQDHIASVWFRTEENKRGSVRFAELNGKIFGR